MKNKILAFGIILALLFSMTVVPSHAASNGTCGANLTWTLDNNGKLTISGTGDMYNYDMYYPKSPFGNAKMVIIEKGVTSIGYAAFYEASNLVSVTIPDSVTHIDRNAFRECSSLTDVYYCGTRGGWNKIIIGISNDPFISATIHFNYKPRNGSCGDNVTWTLDDEGTLTISGTGAMADYIDTESPWYDRYTESIKSVIIENGVTSIGEYTFFGCNSLVSITIPKSMTSVGERAFSDCSSLTEVYYGGDENDWNNISISTSIVFKNPLINATKHYNCIFANKLTAPHNNNGETVTLPEGNILDTGANLNFRNGYVDATNGYVKAGDKKITGSNIYFNNEGKIRLQDGDTAKIEKDNGNGTTDQGFMAGVLNPTGIIKMVLEVTGTANEVDYTGRTITNDFDFTNSEINGLANFGFTVKNIPKPLELSIKIIN